MKKVVKIIFSIIKFLYLFVLVIYLVFVGIHRLSIDRSILGYRFFTVGNNEMSPKYKLNDIIITKDYDPSKLKVGDNISYIGNCCGQGGMIINHKIIEINEEANKIIAKGIDSNVEISYKQVVGKIIGVLPVISTMHHIIKNPIGFIILIVLPLVIAIIVLIIETIKDIKREKLEKVKTNSNSLDSEII